VLQSLGRWHLVERVSGLVFPGAKMDGGTATAAFQVFSAALNRVPLGDAPGLSLTDQGREAGAPC